MIHLIKIVTLWNICLSKEGYKFQDLYWLKCQSNKYYQGLFDQFKDANFQSKDNSTYKLRESNVSKILFKLRTSTIGEGRTHKSTTLKWLEINFMWNSRKINFKGHNTHPLDWHKGRQFCTKQGIECGTTLY